MSNHSQRLARLREAIVSAELDSLLVTNLQNVRYLSGFSGTNATLVVDGNTATLMTDFRYIEQAAEQSPEFAVVDGGEKPRETIAELVAATKLIGFDDADMRVKSHTALQAELASGCELVPAGGIVERLREVKDADELAAVSRAAEIADSIYATLAEEGLIGRKECDVAWRIEWLARERGASGVSFPPIVAAGAHGALPHAEPRDRRIEAGELVVLDLGVVVDGYCSDCTRTFAAGSPSDTAADVYDLVLKAQESALEMVTEGAACSAVDVAARSVIDTAGYGDRFGHSTGHGVGIDVHELPTLSARSDQNLRSGNVVTVEPGVYLPGELGVRIEDLAVVTDAAPRVLTPFPKRLLTVE